MCACACVRLLLAVTLPALAGWPWWCAEGEVVSAGPQRAGPQFAAPQRTAVTVAAGQPAELACRLLHLHDKTVSWVRSRDLQIVCHAGAGFTADVRVSCAARHDARDAHDAGELHVLQVAHARPDDSGLYECQVNTDPKMSLFFNLTVIDEPVPRVVVEAERGAVRGRAGSAVTLACAARYTPARAARRLGTPAPHVAWRRGAAGAALEARGGLSLESEAVEARVTSRLTLTALRAPDAGPYTCSVGNVSDTITLYVLTDDDPDLLGPPLEAMQRDEAHAHGGAGGTTTTCARAALAHLVTLVSLARSLLVLTS